MIGPGVSQGVSPEDPARFLRDWARLEARYLARLERVYADSEDWRQGLRAAAAETFRLVESHPEEARFMVVDSLAAGAVGRGCRQALTERLTAALDTARRQIADPDAIPEATAGWILGIFFDRIYRHLVNEAGPDLASQLPELMFLAVSSYFGTEAGLEELGMQP
jgi:hypothetical protein